MVTKWGVGRVRERRKKLIKEPSPRALSRSTGRGSKGRTRPPSVRRGGDDLRGRDQFGSRIVALCASAPIELSSPRSARPAWRVTATAPCVHRRARRRGCPYAVTEALLDVILLNGGHGLKKSIDINDEDHPVAGQIIGSRAGARWPGRRRSCADARVRRDRPELRLPGEEDQKQGPRRAHAAWMCRAAIAILKAVRDALPPRRADHRQPPPRLRRFAAVGGSLLRDRSRRRGRTATPPCACTGGRSSRNTSAASRWEFLRELKRRYPDRTILGSGDVFTAEDAVRMLRETGVDIVWIARGAIGNPWIFEHAAELLARRRTPSSSRRRSTSSATRSKSTSRSRWRSTANNWPAGGCGRWGSSTAGFTRAADEVKADVHQRARLRDWTNVLDRWYAATAPASGPRPEPRMR